MNDIKFGEWVYVDSKLERAVKYGNVNILGPRYDSKRIKYWRKTNTEEKKVIFLGPKTLKNGYTDFDYESGYIFHFIKTIKAALVCEGPRKNPFYVLLEDIKRIYIDKPVKFKADKNWIEA